MLNMFFATNRKLELGFAVNRVMTWTHSGKYFNEIREIDLDNFIDGNVRTI